MGRKAAGAPAAAAAAYGDINGGLTRTGSVRGGELLRADVDGNSCRRFGDVNPAVLRGTCGIRMSSVASGGDGVLLDALVSGVDGGCSP